MFLRAARSKMLSACTATSAIFFASLEAIASRTAFLASRIFFLQTSLTARRRASFRKAFFPADSCGMKGSMTKGSGNVKH